MDFTRLALISPDGVRTDLSDPQAFLAMSAEGLGMPPLHRLHEISPIQDGATDAGYRLEKRTITLRLLIRAQTPTQLYQRRSQLLSACRPSDEPLTLVVTLPGGELRQIACFLQNGLSFESGRRSGLVLDCTLVLCAPQPTFFDPHNRRLGFTWQAAAGLRFPLAFPAQFGEGWDILEQAVDTTGTWHSPVQIELNGPLENPQIENRTTGARIGLAHLLAAGETVTIDTRPGRTGATNNYGANLMHALEPESDLPSFRLAAGAGNSIRVSGQGGLPGLTQITFTWQDQYLGI